MYRSNGVHAGYLLSVINPATDIDGGKSGKGADGKYARWDRTLHQEYPPSKTVQKILRSNKQFCSKLGKYRIACLVCASTASREVQFSPRCSRSTVLHHSQNPDFYDESVFFADMCVLFIVGILAAPLKEGRLSSQSLSLPPVTFHLIGLAIKEASQQHQVFILAVFSSQNGADVKWA
ncbi:dedicator of cytokinesis protein 10 [Lates japonicus]|uniref:Dedicator of cytokinesis protein 10 n=1 Tax=Lates japonicus TaxID=270547 RepID=A0AAD3NG02_LATJO|nr:dedicator of cytokinesis protein 10 [Lates japonicus]